MKKPKRPTRRQADFIISKKLVPDYWMVERDTSSEMILLGKKGQLKRLEK